LVETLSGYLVFDNTRVFFALLGFAVTGRALGAGPKFDIVTAWRLISSMEFTVGAVTVSVPTKSNDFLVDFLSTRFFLIGRILPGQTRNRFIVSSFKYYVNSGRDVVGCT